MTVLELAKKYYPTLWSAERITALVAAGRLTQKEAGRLTQKEADATGGVTL
ncbi:MAG: XkdX family protein [Angelakisella sp.]